MFGGINAGIAFGLSHWAPRLTDLRRAGFQSNLVFRILVQWFLCVLSTEKREKWLTANGTK